MKHALPLAAAFFAFGFAGAANAVDVVNEDPTTHQVVVTEGEDSESIDVTGGQSIADICGKCVLQVGESDPVQIEGDQVAVIKDGRIEIRPKAN